MTSEELAKVEGTLVVTHYRGIMANLYNGNERTIGGLVVEVVVRDRSGGEVLRRRYALTGGGKPLASAPFTADAGFTLEEGQQLSWSLVSGVLR